MRRLHTGFLAACLALAAGCAQKEAVVDVMVTDATPAAPIRALQTFELDLATMSSGGAAFTWDGVPMPSRASMSFFDRAPPPFRICAVALGEDEDALFHAVSDPVQPILEETVEVVVALERVEPSGEVPEPCGPAVEPWPDGV